MKIKGLTIFLILMSSFMFSAADDVLFFQAEIADKNHAFVDGSYPMSFSIRKNADGSGYLWHQAFTSVTIENGHIAVLLGGPAKPLPEDIFEGSERYLQIKITNGEAVETLTPLFKITSAHFTTASEGTGEVACPSGMTKINYFCIDINRSGPVTYHTALQRCHSRGMRVCNWHESMDACLEGKLDVNNGGIWKQNEWNPDLSWGYRACVWNSTKTGTPACFNLGSEKIIENGVWNMFHYRCCK